MKRIWTVVFIGVTGCATAGQGASSSSTTPSASTVDSEVVSSEELRRDLYAFADDSMRGRETGTPDATRAAIFIANRLAKLGLEPAGDSGFYQRIPMQRDEFTAATRFSVTVNGTTTPLVLGTDLLPLTSLGPGALTRFDASGGIVFAGYGIDDEKLGRHDWQGLNAEGKVLVLVHGAPANADSATRAKYEAQSSLGSQVTHAVSLHPSAIIVLMSDATRSLFDEAAPEALRAVTLQTGAPEPTAAMRQYPMFMLGVAKPGSPLLPAGWPKDDRAQALPGEFTGHIQDRHVKFTGYNVVGIVRGTDPQLNQTYVAYGAHLDHIGIQHGMTPDSIANGADDDGSGTVSLLAIARVIPSWHPKRSVLFVWHAGEEKGLLGSLYFTDHPTVPIDSIVAQLNADMIGRNAPNELYIVGPGAAPNNQSKVLGALLDSLNATSRQAFTINRSFDTLNNPEMVYYRSDHYNYARKGIPIIFFTTGLHADYHKVSDSPDKIAYVKMARVDALMVDLGVAVANRLTRPQIARPVNR